MTKNNRSSAKIKEYWEDPNTISLIDQNLRNIETETVLNYLKKGQHIADMGCGDAISTVQYAKKVKFCNAYERSEYLKKKAKRRIASSGIKNIDLQFGDVLEFGKMKNKFDSIITHGF